MSKKEREWVEKGYHQLAIYNSEVARGLVHTNEYIAEMAEVQKRFDEEHKKV
jgi:hypothetical protein